jgi:hypothetical protein
MVNADLRKKMLHNLWMNEIPLRDADNVVPLGKNEVYRGRVNVAGAGPSLFPEEDLRGIVLANQSSAPFLAFKNVRVSHVVLVDPGSAVMKRLEFVLASPNTYTWIVSSFIDPVLLRRLIERGDRIEVFAHTLHEDPDFNYEVLSSLPHWSQDILTVAQLGSVANASVALASCGWPNCTEIFLSGLDFCWVPADIERVPSIVQTGEHEWKTYFEHEHGTRVRVLGKDTTPALLQYMEQFTALRQVIKQPLVARRYLADLHGLTEAL